jgi:class 3 adenylate cyclase
MTDDLKQLLDDLDDHVASELKNTPNVIDKGDSLVPSDLPIEARCWHKAHDVVAVVADLKSSTLLGLNKHAASTASIYEAATGGAVQILDAFAADFIAIQGDGALGLFWAENRLARAVCAGITIKTFSEKKLVSRLEAKWPALGEIKTGFKIGIASSDLLAKRVGIPRSPHQEPVWAGKSANYATKCAQQADRHQMLVTGSVWDYCEDNDFLAVSCGCGKGPSAGIWRDAEVERLPADDPERTGRLLVVPWCDIHGPEFCSAVMSGERSRPDVTDQRTLEVNRLMSNSLRAKKKRERERTRALRKLPRR